MPRIQLETLVDFTGGLNLQPNFFALGGNESPDLLNVDVDPRGGFRLRGGVLDWAADPSGTVVSLMPFAAGGFTQVVAQIGTGLKYTTGASWTTIGAYVLDGPARSTVFKDRMYIVSGHNDDVVRWNGSAAATVGVPSYNENLDAPTASGSVGKMPRAKVIATWMGSVFVANTIESGTACANRIRWSHPNFPEDWRALDFIDVDAGHEGDEITALVPFGDRLLVFKKKSIHAIYGAPPESLQVAPVSQDVGAPSQEAVVSTDYGVYFYSVPDGVFLFKGGQPEYQFERLRPAALPGGSIGTPPAAATDYLEHIHLGWGNRRLWVSVPWEDDVNRSRVFVLDPQLGKHGSWVAYDLGVGPFLEWAPPGSESQFLAGSVTASRVVTLDKDDQPFDDFGAGAVHIESHYMTRWVDLGMPAMKKRWKRPHIVMEGSDESVVSVQVFTDYDPSQVRRRFSLTTTGAGTDALVWGTGLWGTGLWGSNGESRSQVERGAPLGNGLAVSLKFNGPLTNTDWGVNAVSLTYIPRKVR